jgi:hypothetical protein
VLGFCEWDGLIEIIGERRVYISCVVRVTIWPAATRVVYESSTGSSRVIPMFKIRFAFPILLNSVRVLVKFC